MQASNSGGPEWILNMAPELIVPFIQGLADGGCLVSEEEAKCTFSSKTDPEFIRQVLRKLGIESSVRGETVVIDQPKDIIRAAQLPLFKLREKQQQLERLAKSLEERA